VDFKVTSSLLKVEAFFKNYVRMHEESARYLTLQTKLDRNRLPANINIPEERSISKVCACVCVFVCMRAQARVCVGVFESLG